MFSNYHMIEYIHQSADALQKTLDDNEQVIQALVAHLHQEGIQRLIVTGIGSSYTAAMMAAPALRYHNPLPVHVLPATDLGLYGDRLINRQTLVLVISRSGERDWVVAALKDAIRRGAFGVAMTGVADSLLAQQAQWTLLTGEGAEITFPKTKSVTACAGLLARLALALAADGDTEAVRRLAALRAVPGAIHRTVAGIEARISELTPFIDSHDIMLVCGTGSNYGAALEAGVKVQEAAYVPTLCDDTGNLLHGPLGPLDNRWLVLALVTAYDLELSKELLQLTGKLGAHRLSIVEPGVDLNGVSDQILTLPEKPDPLLAGLIYLPAIQLITYYLALARGRNPDQPDFMQAILDVILPPGRREPGT